MFGSHLPGRRPMSGVVSFIAAGALLLLSACALRPAPPQVDLIDLRVGELTLSHAHLIADLRIYNPNPVPITLRNVSYQFLLNGIRVAGGQSLNEVRIGADEVAQTSLRLSTGYLDLLRFTTGREPGEAIRYALDGSVRIGGYRIFDTVFPFRREGDLDPRKLPLRQ